MILKWTHGTCYNTKSEVTDFLIDPKGVRVRGFQTFNFTNWEFEAKRTKRTCHKCHSLGFLMNFIQRQLVKLHCNLVEGERKERGRKLKNTGNLRIGRQ